MLIGTSTIKVAGKKKNITKNFTVEALGKVISTANPTVWGTIIGRLDDQTDLQVALDSKQNNITLTTIGSNGPSTLIGSVLNIPNYFTAVPTKTSELINDGEDGINPFITLADIPPSTIPNLNDVLLEGNTSLLDAKIGELYLYDGPNSNYAKISIQDDLFSVIRATSGTSMFFVDNGYSFTINNEIANATIINPLTTNRTYTLPDASGTIALTSDIPTQGLTSVGLTMPAAFNVANSPLTSDGTIAVSAAGTSSQYIRGDGQLATLPTGAGGGSTVAYYLNGSINASVAGYKQLSNTATIGGGTDFTLVGNGLIAQFLTDAGNPNRTEIPGGAWNFEMFFQASSAGGSQKFYVELLKYDGTTFTSIASSVSVAEEITGGTTIDLYLTSLAVPTAPLLVTDRLAIRVYIVDNSGGRTITLHTEDNTLCEIITTFSGGVTSLNGLTANTQYLAVGTTGTDFNISSLVDTHTFNLPTASATNRGALSSTDWTAFNGKFNLPALTSGSVLFSNGTTIAQDNSNLFWDDTNNRLGIGTNAPSVKLQVEGGGTYIKPGVSGTTALILEPIAAASLSWGYSGNIVGSLSQTSTDAVIRAGSGKNLTFETLVGGERMRINSAGNTLINTTVDQGGKLQIKAPGALSTDIALRVRNSADTADLLVTNGLGNVGIGISSPSDKLQVSGGGVLLDYDAKIWSRVGTGIGVNAELVLFDGSGNTFLTNRYNTGNLFFRTSTISNSPQTRMTITPAGNVGIGTTAPVASAKLDITSTTQGFLPPRMTNAQRLLIATPAVGLCVYCTDVVEGLYINKSTGWTYIG
jgi:hypothetical protein